MAGTLEGKVALVTGAARGIGRAHAIRLAEAGADVVVTDLATDSVGTVDYPLGTNADLEETAEEVRGLGVRSVTALVDVRSQEQLDAAVSRGIDELGAIDILIANAGVLNVAPVWEITEQQWDDTMAVNLTGVWKSIKAVTPHMMQRKSGSMVLVSSINGIEPGTLYAHYTAAKHGVIGLMKATALELAPHGIRCNAVCPGAIDTPQNRWQGALDMMAGHAGGTMEERDRIGKTFAPLSYAGWLPASAIADASTWLAGDDARYVTGIAIPVEAGHFLVPGYVDPDSK